MVQASRRVGWAAAGLVGAGIVTGALVAVDTATPHDSGAGVPGGSGSLWAAVADDPTNVPPAPTAVSAPDGTPPDGTAPPGGPAAGWSESPRWGQPGGSGQPSAVGSGSTAARPAVPVLRRWLRQPGLHGEVVVETADGFLTVAMQRGTIESIGSTALVVRSRDGVVQTWLVGEHVMIRVDGLPAPLSALRPGDSVEVVGTVEGDVLSAQVIKVTPTLG